MVEHNGHVPPTVLFAQPAPASPRATDNLDLDLPPAVGPAESLPPAALHALADLYLLAELEQAGVIPAAEALVDARASLQLPTEQLAERLEHFAQAERSWYDRASREQLFARVFGIGPGATSATDGTVNHEFEQRLATLCAAINRYVADQTRFGPPPSTDLAAIGESATGLLANLGLRQYGNTVFAAHRLQEQMNAAITLLKEPAVQSLFGVTGFWQVLERILAPNVPDLARLLERGQAGRRLLTWLGDAGSAVGGSSGTSLGSDVAQAAARWLAASGLDGGTTSARSAA